MGMRSCSTHYKQVPRVSLGLEVGDPTASLGPDMRDPTVPLGLDTGDGLQHPWVREGRPRSVPGSPGQRPPCAQY